MAGLNLSNMVSITPISAPAVEEAPPPTLGIDLANVQKEVPESAPKGEPLSGIKMAGFQLAVITMGIMLVFILFLIIFFFVTQLDASDAIKAAGKDEKLASLISNEKKAYRDFILEVSKTVLLNLLLPILTAILGYIFGSAKPEK
ncbi:hypothetical protein ACFFGT_29845 [Mucilaginibacter angelicae]|uniref:Uncharacterized protein n=1 Tax=Mucilaginibacter angelicae TaxID=869718 RepID=A0ABV6LG58_9SPHI